MYVLKYLSYSFSESHNIFFFLESAAFQRIPPGLEFQSYAFSRPSPWKREVIRTSRSRGRSNCSVMRSKFGRPVPAILHAVLFDDTELILKKFSVNGTKSPLQYSVRTTHINSFHPFINCTYLGTTILSIFQFSRLKFNTWRWIGYYIWCHKGDNATVTPSRLYTTFWEETFYSCALANPQIH